MCFLELDGVGVLPVRYGSEKAAGFPPNGILMVLHSQKIRKSDIIS